MRNLVRSLAHLSWTSTHKTNKCLLGNHLTTTLKLIHQLLKPKNAVLCDLKKKFVNQQSLWFYKNICMSSEKANGSTILGGKHKKTATICHLTPFVKICGHTYFTLCDIFSIVSSPLSHFQLILNCPSLVHLEDTCLWWWVLDESFKVFSSQYF